jgi:hypothetical protein
MTQEFDRDNRMSDEELDEAQEELIYPPQFVTLNTNGRPPMNLDIGPLTRTCVNGVVTARDVLGMIEAELSATAQVFVNSNLSTLDTPVHEGDVVNVSGKLAGGLE